MKKAFIDAYRALYGASIKEAAAVYKIASKGYINAVIDTFKSDAKKAFYND